MPLSPEEIQRLKQKALDEYNYGETYSAQAPEVVAMAVTRGRFAAFQKMFIDAGVKNFTDGLHIACAMLTAAAAITHLEEIIRVPEQATPEEPPAQPEGVPNAAA